MLITKGVKTKILPKYINIIAKEVQQFSQKCDKKAKIKMEKYQKSSEKLLLDVLMCEQQK